MDRPDPALAETGASERLPMAGAARCRARPTTLVHQMAASVTSGRHGAGSAVRDDGISRRGSAASRGDVAGTDNVAVPKVATGPTREAPAPGLGTSRLALRTGRRGAPLVDAHDVDARELRLVRQGVEQVGAPPGIRHAAVLATPGVVASDALGVADHQGADRMGFGPTDHLFGRLVVHLVDPPEVAGLGSSLSGAELAPPPRPALAPPRRFVGHRTRAGL
jgi:hypothetical protein